MVNFIMKSIAEKKEIDHTANIAKTIIVLSQEKKKNEKLINYFIGRLTDNK